VHKIDQKAKKFHARKISCNWQVVALTLARCFYSTRCRQGLRRSR